MSKEIKMKTEKGNRKSNKWAKEHNEIIWNIVTKERDKLKIGEDIEFAWGKKRFVLKRIK